MTQEEIKALMDKFNAGVGDLKGAFASFEGKFEPRLKMLETAFLSRAVSIPGVENGDGTKKFSFARAIYAIATKDFSNAPFEKAVFDETQKKAMATNTGIAGGYIVPVEIVAEIIPQLMAKIVCKKLGATILDNLVGSPVVLNKQTGGATVYDVAENEAPTESELSFGQINLVPHGLSALVKMSRRLSVLANPSIELMTRNDLTGGIARAFDYRALRGKGFGGQSMGIVNTPGVQPLVLGNPNGAVPTIDNLWDMINLAEMANADEGKLGWAMSPKLLNIFRKVKDTAGNYLLQVDPAQPGKRTLCGFNVETTTQLPINLVKGSSTNCAEIIFGNWADLILAMWGGLVLEASTETSTAFEKHQIWVKAVQDIDVGVRNPESFVVAPDAKVAS